MSQTKLPTPSEASSTESSPTQSEASSTESSPELTPEEIDKQQKKNEKKTKENEKLKKKQQKNDDAEFVKKLREYNTDLSDFITKLNSLNANMRNEIEDVFKNKNINTEKVPDSDKEKLKKAWKKHKPFIVRSRGEVLGDDGHPEMKVRKCALNFGAHRCVYHFLPFDKKKIYKKPEVAEQADDAEEEEKEDKAADVAAKGPEADEAAEGAAENLSPEIEDTKPKKNIKGELKQCKQYTKVVGIDLYFYKNVDPNSLVAKTIEAAIKSGNINYKEGRHYFCDKHLKQLVGLVPRQIDNDSLAYHLIATQPFYEGDYVATFSQIKVSNEVDLQDELRISPVSYFKSTLNTNDNKDIGTLDDTCFKDLGDYITDPNADNVFDMYLKIDQRNTEEELENLFNFSNKCNVEIELKEVMEENKKKNIICLKATRQIYKNEIIYLNFGIEYWRKYLKQNTKNKNEPAIKSDLRYYKNLVSYKYLKDNIEDIKNKYVNLLLMDTLSYFPKEEDNEIVEVDSVPKKKLSLNRLNNLYKHHFQFNKQTK